MGSLCLTASKGFKSINLDKKNGNDRIYKFLEYLSESVAKVNKTNITIPGFSTTLGLHRTIGVPDNNKTYDLPPSLGELESYDELEFA